MAIISVNQLSAHIFFLRLGRAPEIIESKQSLKLFSEKEWYIVTTKTKGLFAKNQNFLATGKEVAVALKEGKEEFSCILIGQLFIPEGAFFKTFSTGDIGQGSIVVGVRGDEKIIVHLQPPAFVALQPNILETIRQELNL